MHNLPKRKQRHQKKPHNLPEVAWLLMPDQGICLQNSCQYLLFYAVLPLQYSKGATNQLVCNWIHHSPHKTSRFFYKWNGYQSTQLLKPETRAPPFIHPPLLRIHVKTNLTLKYHSNLTYAIPLYHRFPFLIHKLVKEHLNYVSVSPSSNSVYIIPEFF